MSHLLEIKKLKTSFNDRASATKVISDLSLTLASNESLGLVGESGSGKSVTSLATMRLLPNDSAEVSGEILFKGENLLTASDSEMQSIRGNRIAMIFQESRTSLNPIHTLNKQIAESIRLHNRRISKKEAESKALAL